MRRSWRTWREHEREAQQRVAQEGERAMVEALVRDGFIDNRTFERQIELLPCPATAPTACSTSWSSTGSGRGRQARGSGSRCEIGAISNACRWMGLKRSAMA